MRLATGNHLRYCLKLYDNATHARRPFFELAAPKFAVGTFHITSMWPQMEQKHEVHGVQRPTTGVVRYEHAGTARTLFYHTPHNFHRIVRFELRHLDDGRS